MGGTRSRLSFTCNEIVGEGSSLTLGAADRQQMTSQLARDLMKNIGEPTEARVPDEPGFYAWWVEVEQLGVAQPAFPAVRPEGAADEWSLLYVGIAPKSEASRTSRSIRKRVDRDHRNGNIGGSTFRQSIAALLWHSLGLRPKEGHDRPRLEDEQPLSDWLHAHCGLSIVGHASPWEYEEELIRLLTPPLNLLPGFHDFRYQVSQARDQLRHACGL
jgi:hypothetical protein